MKKTFFTLLVIILSLGGFLVFGSKDLRARQVMLSWLPFDFVPQRWAVTGKRIFPPRTYKLDNRFVNSKQQYHLICLGEDTRETHSFLVPEKSYYEIQRNAILDHNAVSQWAHVKGAPEIPVLLFNSSDPE
ncbi:hypothetical protein [Cerasicoccus frondis]|uniref:hypothetical protein n=1 Tax=Cerasicoccus frondis TaxID=490090 RepID=UPI0028527ACF|nr:hypothetical protein [Cerasicoccus frondis]